MSDRSGSARRRAPLPGSPLSDPVVLRILATVVLGAAAAESLGVLLPAWGVPEQWPRAGTLTQPVFVTILVLGLSVECLGIVVAGRRPLVGHVVTFGTYVGLVLGLDTPTWLISGTLPVATVVFLLAHHGPFHLAMPVLTATLVLYSLMTWEWAVWREGASAAQAGLFLFHLLTSFAPLTIAGAIVGAFVGRQSRRIDAARRATEEARLERERSIARAQKAERARVAQELHDVTAQHMAGLLSLADAAVDIAQDDPATALELVAEARAEGRFAAASIYGALSELRSGDSAKAAPTPGALQIHALIDHWRARGMDVDLLTLTEMDDLPAVVSVTAYRTVQEALANAAKHAPGAHASVRILTDAGRLRITVVNCAPARSAGSSSSGLGLGWGLDGLRERVALLGGTLSAGPTPEGGWRVSVDLPPSEAAAEV